MFGILRSWRISYVNDAKAFYISNFVKEFQKSSFYLLGLFLLAESRKGKWLELHLLVVYTNRCGGAPHRHIPLSLCSVKI